MDRNSFQKEFERKLAETNLIRQSEKLLVACSGGPDSVALFYLLWALRRRWKLRLALLYYHHGLRRGADTDRNFVKSLARRHGIPYFDKKGNVRREARKEKESLEEAARKARYRFFCETAERQKFKKIVLAHHLDDQAETVLMRILQGTGLRGLTGIQPKLQIGKVTFVRPLLEFSKQAILAFLKSEKIKFRYDRTNHHVKFLRNRIRRELLPRIKKTINPRAAEALARIPVIVREEMKLLDGMEDTAWQQAFLRRQSGKIYLKRGAFAKFSSPLQFRLLNRAIKKIHAKSGLSFEAWQKLQPNLKKSQDRCSLPRKIELSLTSSKICLSQKK